MTNQTLAVRAYYTGRNSIAHNGKSYYGIKDCPEINSAELRKAFNEGVRDVGGEIRLDADTEWDREEAA